MSNLTNSENLSTPTQQTANQPAEITAFNVLSQAFDLANRRGAYSLGDSALLNQQLVVLRNFLVSHFSALTSNTAVMSQNTSEVISDSNLSETTPTSSV
mgnify:CR=1 FL=1